MTDHFVEVPKKVLSPAAQTVDDATCYDMPNRVLAAAAIRAAADQVKPTLARTPWLANEDGYFNETFQNMEALGELNVHYHLLAIATELEGQ